MSVAGIGTDLVEIARIARLLDRHGDRFVTRVLTTFERRELDRLAKPAAFVARRFAVKEAAAKALGTGIAAGVSFQDFEVSNDDRGAPRLSLAGEAARRCREAGITAVHLSLTDQAAYALAFVVLER